MDAAIHASLALLLRAAGMATGLVLLAAAFYKVRDWPAFRGALANYELLPPIAVVPFAAALPVAEAIAGVALLDASLRIAGAWLAVAALGVSTAGVAINVARGRTAIDCGCGGLDGQQRLSWALVARNAVLLAALAAGTEVATPASATLVTDATLVFATLALVALYAAASQLLANRPLLAKLASRS
jgi:hypothetical protein